jgi:prephenate dehydrogenase
MAGGPEGGLERARPDLFRGKRWILCPEGVDPDVFASVEELVRALGAEPVSMSVEQHDLAVALTSHVPQLFGGSLLAQASARGAWPARGPAFDAATRAVSTNHAMWRDVFATNSDAISSALASVCADLQAVREGLERNPPDVAPALELLARSAQARRT